MLTWLAAAQHLSEIESTIKEDLQNTEAAGLSIVAIHILNELYQSDGQKASELARKVGRAATSFTPILDQLENDKLLKRSPHKTDRRAVIISLTVKGKALQTVIENAIGNAEVRYGGK